VGTKRRSRVSGFFREEVLEAFGSPDTNLALEKAREDLPDFSRSILRRIDTVLVDTTVPSLLHPVPGDGKTAEDDLLFDPVVPRQVLGRITDRIRLDVIDYLPCAIQQVVTAFDERVEIHPVEPRPCDTECFSGELHAVPRVEKRLVVLAVL